MTKADYENGEFPYLHGFSTTEQQRLLEQAALTEYDIYCSLDFTEVEDLLEVGMGVGAQTEILLRRFPTIKKITGIDLSEKQLAVAKKHLEHFCFTKNRFTAMKMDATNMEFPSKTFDGAFLCWVLEHVPNPLNVLSEVRRVLRPGAKICLNEVMNSSFFLDPYSPNTWQYWMAFNDCQASVGGDPFIGLKLGNMMHSLGLTSIETELKTWHFDNRTPHKRHRYIKFFSNLLLGAEQKLLDEGRVTEEICKGMRKEIADVLKNPNAVFYYSFMQARGIVS